VAARAALRRRSEADGAFGHGGGWSKRKRREDRESGRREGKKRERKKRKPLFFCASPLSVRRSLRSWGDKH
jgi:hypothetical protein